MLYTILTHIPPMDNIMCVSTPRTQKTQNSEIVYLALKLQIQATHKSNNYIIPDIWETSIKTKELSLAHMPLQYM